MDPCSFALLLRPGRESSGVGLLRCQCESGEVTAGTSNRAVQGSCPWRGAFMVFERCTAQRAPFYFLRIILFGLRSSSLREEIRTDIFWISVSTRSARTE